MDPEDVLRFWTEEIDAPKAWFVTAPEVDEAIQKRFADHIAPAASNTYDAWLAAAPSALALILLLDQFPRNAFRGSAEAFAYDAAALSAANTALTKGYDLQTEPGLRAFFYMPLEHSEDIWEQQRCVALMEGRLAGRRDYVFHARAHRDVIRRFGRFPHRNAVLGRQSTPGEETYLAQGGYNPLK